MLPEAAQLASAKDDWRRRCRFIACGIGIGATVAVWLQIAVASGNFWNLIPAGLLLLGVVGCYRVYYMHVDSGAVSIVGGLVLVGVTVWALLTARPDFVRPDDGLAYLWIPYGLIALFFLSSLLAVIDGLAASVIGFSRRRREARVGNDDEGAT